MCFIVRRLTYCGCVGTVSKDHFLVTRVLPTITHQITKSPFRDTLTHCLRLCKRSLPERVPLELRDGRIPVLPAGLSQNLREDLSN